MRQQRLNLGERSRPGSGKNPLDKMRQFDEQNLREARKVLADPKHQPLLSIAWAKSVMRRLAPGELAALEQQNSTNGPDAA